ncbi:hypothetical protein [Paraflavitalea speifideaquila]|uniref:hypothetical protein n=1 Tax=Paraflavitalea speifideaquila TaxID=3076558 RepID=UPI0028EC77F9|nr:hypothetical protein [Paraflavitalea speifideiaquila]
MKICFLYIAFLITIPSTAQDSLATKRYAQQLIKAYPDCIVGIQNNYVVFKNGVRLLFDDGKFKTLAQQYAAPDIEDQLRAVYMKGKHPDRLSWMIPEGSGMILFKVMYGATPAAVKENLVTITWLPASANQTLRVSRINGVDKRCGPFPMNWKSCPRPCCPMCNRWLVLLPGG